MLITLPSGAVVLAPVDPSTWVDQSVTTVGTPVTTEDLESGVAAAVAFGRRRPQFQGIGTAATSVPTSTWTVLPISTEFIDTFAGHNDTGNTARVKAPYTASGYDWYLITGYVPFSASSAARSHISGVRLGSSAGIYEGMKIPGGSGHATDMLVVDLLRVAQGDYIELMAYQDTGSPLSITVSGKTPSLTMRWACSGTGTTVALPSAPRTWTADDQLTADLAGTDQVPLNLHVRDTARFLRYPPAARIHSIGTSQTIPAGAGTWTSIAMTGENLDTYGGHDNSTNNTRYVCQRSGLYYVYGLAAVSESGSPSGYRACRLLVNGTTGYAGMSSVPATTSTLGTALAASAHIRLTAGDYVELQMTQTQGSALSVKGGAGDHSRLIALWKRL